MAPLTVTNPICIVCGELASQSLTTCSLFTIDGLDGVFAACTAHSVDEVREGLQGCRAAALPYPDRDYWPMELAHPYDPEGERARAAEARANAQTAALVEGKTRARRVVHDLAPSDDPCSILDGEPCRWCMESGAHVCPYRVRRQEAFEKMARSLMPEGSLIAGLALHHIDGDPMNNDPANLAVVPAIARGGMTDEDYARFGLKA